MRPGQSHPIISTTRGFTRVHHGEAHKQRVMLGRKSHSPVHKVSLCRNRFHFTQRQPSQEAEKKIRLKRLPRVLTLHLKRFKYVESLESFSKLSHRVVFPLELRTPNMTDGAGEADADGRLYRRVGGGARSEHRCILAWTGFIVYYDGVVTRTLCCV